ncbi:TIGR04283 family arsenosugar biosynthesis glycosyltransferase [Bradyrhizobium sp.]|uniref:TIGR04283 family arsenosugar biosynthesis glycosyltransferase n=1 Tax=Bradyrhizobium sp. TaxID=376 RepID=UPI004037A8CD
MISIIIPVLDEAARLPPLLQVLTREKTEHEVIVVDGGSLDGSAEIAQQMGAKVVLSKPGRGTQLSRGVTEARGDVLFFLHADTVFPEEGLRSIAQILAGSPNIVGGNFRLLFDGGDRFSRGLTRVYGWLRYLRLYYGDSGIFVRRSAYDAIGGMRAIPVMEDLDFVARMERYGKTCCIADPPLITSSRRFEGRRASEIVYGWMKLHFLFWLGVSPDRLAIMYMRQQPTVRAQAAGGFGGAGSNPQGTS